MSRRLLTLAAAATITLALAGCGGDDDAADDTTTTVTAGSPGLPTVSGPLDEKPTIAIPDTDPPAELVVEVLQAGSGATVQAGDLMAAHYVGQLWRDGSQFDASWDRGQPATFPVGVGSLIAGWDEGLVGQTYGSRLLLVVPPEKGYGPTGNPNAGITGDDTLVFVVDLIEAVG